MVYDLFYVPIMKELELQLKPIISQKNNNTLDYSMILYLNIYLQQRKESSEIC